jgi:predicted  nucleic acid-binding Zn-ribbon protein
MDSEIDHLAALQDMDRRLKDKRDSLSVLVAEIEELSQRKERQRAELEQMRSDQTTLDAQRAELDAKLDTEGNRIRDNRMKMNRVRNERELMAMRREVDLAKEANKLLEEQLIAIMEQLEALTARIASAEEALTTVHNEVEQATTAHQDRIAELHREIDAMGAERATAADRLSGSLRVKYEQIFARRGGSAVVEVRNGTCMGCRMNVPPQLYNELQKYRDVRLCPNCHRILFWRPAAGEGTAP